MSALTVRGHVALAALSLVAGAPAAVAVQSLRSPAPRVWLDLPAGGGEFERQRPREFTDGMLVFRIPGRGRPSVPCVPRLVPGGAIATLTDTPQSLDKAPIVLWRRPAKLWRQVYRLVNPRVPGDLWFYRFTGKTEPAGAITRYEIMLIPDETQRRY